ncbi:tryptophan--tRNA ligase [Ottowia sp.]|uniref:tryptophan--tRNA ligase n=1 Tax=Ottowia sp. TaxID=1898956 RepID=UPI003A88AFAC
MTSVVRVLTGITTTGTPHLGNYVGAIRPTVRASRKPDTQSFLFLADYHALIKCDDPARIQRSTLEIAASWLAAGLDPEHVTFYRQSDIPEIPELMWLLTCVAGKGLLNRAHAYKAMLDKNAAAGQDPDADVSAGLFMYPVLMAADILMFKAHQVPVGRDQVQHIEMARDMAASFNHLYGELLVPPAAVIDDHVALLPGLDGRKMSKSYDNTIALFGPRDLLRKQIMSILTDSSVPGEAKATESSAVFQLYRAFAEPAETSALAQAFADGIAWGNAKQQLFERIDHEISPMRERYNHLVQHPAEVERLLKAGAAKARAIATPFMDKLRHAVGLRPMVAASSQSVAPKAVVKSALPTFKQYRAEDKLFYFKLVDVSGATLIQSLAFDSPRDAGQTIKLLQSDGVAAFNQITAQIDLAASQPVHLIHAALEQLSKSLAE